MINADHPVSDGEASLSPGTVTTGTAPTGGGGGKGTYAAAFIPESSIQRLMILEN